jgi:quercetin 2,3-dioxygenase
MQDVDHHLQIWLAPRKLGLEPDVRTLRIGRPSQGQWIILASGYGDGGVALEADARVSWGRAEAGTPLTLPAAPGSSRYLHLMSGTLTAAGDTLEAGDALVLRDANVPLALHAAEAAEVLGFELPATAP